MDVKVLALVALLSVAVRSQSYGQVYCGRQLAMKLAALCNDLIKRDAAPELHWPWIPRSSARSMNMRSRRQVVEECCEKPCTVDELLRYCRN